MIGILFAQGSALLQATQNILNKKFVQQEEPFVVIWYSILLSLFFLIPVVIVSGIPVLGENFYLFLGVRVLLDIFAISSYFYALKHGDISIVIPLSTFSVVFSLLSSSVINKELPSAFGIVGILVVMSGTYLLNLPQKNRMKNLLMPFSLLFSDLSARLILLSALLYGIIYSVNKAGINASSTSFFTLSAALGLLVSFSFILFYKHRLKVFNLLRISKLKQFLPLGLIDGVKVFLFMLAVTYTFVAFADASDNTTAVYSTLLAGLIFKEKIRERLFPISIMMLGVLIITISSYFSV